MFRYSTDFKIGIFFLAFSLLAGGLLVPTIDNDWRRLNVVGDDFFTLGPRFFPVAILVCLGIVAFALIVSGWRRDEEKSIASRHHRAVAVTILVCISYVTLLPLLGVVIPTFFCLTGFFAYFGLRGWLRLIVLPAGVSLLLFWVFGKLLLVHLPPELWERF
jgi:hypothetical protein